jgi:hypothetical protein
MWEDPIVKEVRKAREEHSARFGHDLQKIVLDLKEREKKSGRRYVSYSPRPVHPVVAGRREEV